MAFPQFSVVTSGPIYFAQRLAGKIHNVPPYCLCQIRHLLQMTLIWSHSTGRDLVQRRCLTKSFQTRLLAMLMILHKYIFCVFECMWMYLYSILASATACPLITSQSHDWGVNRTIHLRPAVVRMEDASYQNCTSQALQIHVNVFIT